jgi:hypothetical protein
MGLPHQPLVNPRARLVLTNDGRGAFAFESFRSGESLAGCRIVVVPTFMEVLDTTIAVVALRYIAGGLCRRRLMTVNGFSPAT